MLVVATSSVTAPLIAVPSIAAFSSIPELTGGFYHPDMVFVGSRINGGFYHLLDRVSSLPVR